MQREYFRFSLTDLKPPSTTERAAQQLNSAAQLTLGLGITDSCNLRCPKCYYSKVEGPQSAKRNFMSLERLKALLTDLGQLGHILIGLEGEPLCHPHFEDILRLCAAHAATLDVVSNAQRLGSTQLMLMRELNLSSLTLSCDGADPHSYDLLHPPGAFDRFCAHAQEAVACLGERVHLHSVLCSANHDCAVKLPVLCAELGIGLLSVANLRDHAYAQQQGLRRLDDKPLETLLCKMIEEAGRVGVCLHLDPISVPAPVLDTLARQSLPAQAVTMVPNLWPCGLPWQMASVLSDGRLFACCGDFAPQEIPGNKPALEGIFNHEGLIALRSALARGEYPECCAACRGSHPQ